MTKPHAYKIIKSGVWQIFCPTCWGKMFPRKADIKAPAPPPRYAPNPLAKPKQRKTHLRAVDPILGREQTLRDVATVRELLAAVNWQGLTEFAASRIAEGYRNGRPGLRNIIERELVLLAAEMTLLEDESARVVMALLAVIRRTEASAADLLGSNGDQVRCAGCGKWVG